MDDPYKILGLERNATQAQIRSAYRKLAKKHHPDLNPGDAEAEKLFKSISSAHDLLADPEQKGRFDRGEIDMNGTPRAPQQPPGGGGRTFYRDFSDDGSGFRSSGGFAPEDLDSLFGSAFGRRGGRGFPAQGASARYSMTVDFLEAANGAVKRLSLPDGKTLDVTIPAGFEDGQTLRLRGKGQPGFNGGPAGDVLIEVAVAPHPVFTRSGKDVVVVLPVTLKEAVLGAKVQVPTIKGPVSLAIPPHSNTGQRLRLKGRGIAGGHQYVELKVVLPAADEPELKAFLETWEPRHPSSPRAGMVDE